MKTDQIKSRRGLLRKYVKHPSKTRSIPQTDSEVDDILTWAKDAADKKIAAYEGSRDEVFKRLTQVRRKRRDAACPSNGLGYIKEKKHEPEIHVINVPVIPVHDPDADLKPV